MSSRRVQVSGDLFHGKVPEGAVYVGRGAPGLKASPYRNPYPVKRWGTSGSLPTWSLLALWWHALRAGHRMATAQDGAFGPRFRFCWECDRQQVEKALGFESGNEKGGAVMSRLLTRSEERRQFARIVRGLLRQERQDLAAVEHKHPPVTRQIGCDVCGLPCVPGLTRCQGCLDVLEKEPAP